MKARFRSVNSPNLTGRRCRFWLRCEGELATLCLKCHIEHMVEISIRELHMKTGEWVRKASDAEGIVILERGRPVAKIVPFTDSDNGIAFANRTLVPGFSDLPKMAH